MPIRRPAFALALAALVLASASPAPAASGEAPLPATRVVVGVDDPTRAAALPGATLLRWAPELRAAILETRDPVALEEAARADAQVHYVERDVARPLFHLTPNDPSYASQYAPGQVGLDAAWDTTLGDLDATVCIVDSGARLTHVDLPASRLRGARNVVDNGSNVADDTGHGTHVLGIAAASVHNAQAIAGAGNVGYAIAKVGGDEAFLSDVALGIQWCSDLPDARLVISMSLGCSAASLRPLHGAGEACYSQAVVDAIANAQAAGRIVVASAGNDGSCYSCVAFPARLAGVVSVGCTRQGGALCAFSSTGEQLALVAPGDSILSTSRAGDAATETLSGTSMSAPLVAGALALYWSHDTAITAAALRQRLMDTAQPLGAAGHDALFGCGELDVQRLFAGTGSPCAPTPLPPCDTNPVNDCRANALPLPESGILTFSNANANDETNETHPCDSGKTVWYKFTAHRNESAAVSARGGTADGVVAVWERAPGAGERFLGCHDLFNPLFFMEFACVAGREYEVQLGGSGGDVGSIRFEHHLCAVAPAPPDAPRNLTAAPGPTRGTVALAWGDPAWDGASPLTAFHILRGDTACAGMALVATLPPEARAHVDDASEGALHCYHVRAVNALGNGTIALRKSAAHGLPVPPAGVATAGGFQKVRVTWMPPANATGANVTGYAVESAPAASGPWTRFATTDATAREANETGLAEGETRWYRVLATNAYGDGTPSVPRAASSHAPPGAPRNVTAGPGSSAGQVRVAWAAPASDGGAPVTGYRVYANGALVGLANASARSFLHSGLGENETRSYAVSATNLLGEGAANAPVDGTTMTRPTAPRDLAARSSLAGILLTWNASAWNGGGNVTRYEIARASAPGGPFEPIANSTEASYRDVSQPLLQASYYRVRAANAAGLGPASDVACAHTDARLALIDPC